MSEAKGMDYKNKKIDECFVALLSSISLLVAGPRPVFADTEPQSETILKPHPIFFFETVRNTFKQDYYRIKGGFWTAIHSQTYKNLRFINGYTYTGWVCSSANEPWWADIWSYSFYNTYRTY